MTFRSKGIPICQIFVGKLDNVTGFENCKTMKLFENAEFDLYSAVCVCARECLVFIYDLSRHCVRWR